MWVFAVIVVTFGLCFALDKGFTKLFRSQPQHLSGKSVRLHKYYGLGGILLSVLGLGLLVYFMTFGLFYDEDSFLLTTFGKKTGLYKFRQIKGQKLYNNAGQMLIELYLDDGRSVQLQSTMTGAYEFLDHAFAAWCAQRNKRVEDCDFHDPDNSLWFPTMED